MLSILTSAGEQRIFNLSETLGTPMEAGYELEETIQPVEDASKQPESIAKPSGRSLVSEMLGISEEEVDVLASELHAAISPILAAHGNTLIICDRLGGAEMTLGQAVNTIWPPSATGAMIIEGLASVSAEIQRMLNSQKKEQEEQEDDETEAEQEGQVEAVENTAKQAKPDNKSDIKNNDKPDQKTAAKAERPQAQTNTTESSRPAVKAAENLAAKSTGPEKSTLPTSSAGVTEAAPAPNQNSQAKNEADTLLAGDTDSNARTGDLETEEASVVSILTDGQSQEEIILDETEPDILEQPEILDIPVDLDGEIPLDEPIELTQDVEIILDDPVFANANTEAEPGDLDYEPEDILDEQAGDDSLDLDDQTWVVAEYEATDPLEGPAETADHISVGLELHQWPEDELKLRSENMAEDQGIKDSLVQLAEAIEDSEPEETEAATQILDKIMEAPAKLPESGDEENIEAEVQQELEELFTELLELLEIEYTPELIESLVLLTIRRHLEKEVAGKLEIQKDDSPQDPGTHEIIRELLAILAITDQPKTQHAYALGWSALELTLASAA